MHAKDIIKWNEISVVLTGSPNTVRSDRPNKKHADKIEALLEFVQNWIDKKGDVGEVKVSVKVNKSVYGGFPNRYETQDDVPNMTPDALKKIWNDAIPKKTGKPVVAGDLVEIQTPSQTKKQDYVSVDSLPLDRKMMTEDGYRGLYSSGKKFYTNKVNEGKLDIREWTKLDKAKKYLDSLK